MWWLVAGFTVLLPLFCTPGGYDVFRLPKELLLRGEAISIIAVFATIVLFRGFSAVTPLLPSKRVLLLAAVIASWSLVAFALSTNRPVSGLAFEYVVTALIVFFGSYAACRGREAGSVVLVAVIPAIVNAVLAFLQATSLWNPFRFDPSLPSPSRTSALIGNANDVGAYLMPVVLMTFVLAAVAWSRWWWLVSGILLVGLVASHSLTAMVSLSVGAITLLFLLPGSKKMLKFGALVVILALSVAIVPPLRARAAHLRQAWAKRNYDELTSHRIYPITVAWAMFTDHPLTGEGPGTFKFHYLDYRRALNERHPLWYLAEVENFGEAHSDHLQILAEEGLPGYLLFLIALFSLGTGSISRGQLPDAVAESEDARLKFARLGALPLAFAFGVLTLAGFPLEIAAATQVTIYFAAAILAWSTLP